MRHRRRLVDARQPNSKQSRAEQKVSDLVPSAIVLEALEGRPMTVRYMDPPLHEFLPQNPNDIADLAKRNGHD